MMNENVSSGDIICQNCNNHTDQNYSAMLESGDRICFQCCGEFDQKLMEETGHIDLYLTIQNKSFYVQNFPGTLKFPIESNKLSKHHKTGIRMDLWFRDNFGITWWGVKYGDSLVHCKRLNGRLN